MSCLVIREVIAVMMLGSCPPSLSFQDIGNSKADSEPPGLRATQLAMSIGDDRGEVRFRATIVKRRGNMLTVLTAAHCLARFDEGRTIQLRQGNNVADAIVRSVIHNPAYDDAPDGAIPGADNAVAVLETRTTTGAQKTWIESLGIAQLSTESIPEPAGEPVSVLVVDQFEELHALRGGNYSNPRWLEWGPRYRPIPGDSGSGVFVRMRGRDGRAKLVQIGVVTDRSPSGGGASVVFLRMRWLAESLYQPRAPGLESETAR